MTLLPSAFWKLIVRAINAGGAGGVRVAGAGGGGGGGGPEEEEASFGIRIVLLRYSSVGCRA